MCPRGRRQLTLPDLARRTRLPRLPPRSGRPGAHARARNSHEDNAIRAARAVARGSARPTYRHPDSHRTCPRPPSHTSMLDPNDHRGASATGRLHFAAPTGGRRYRHPRGVRNRAVALPPRPPPALPLPIGVRNRSRLLFGLLIQSRSFLIPVALHPASLTHHGAPPPFTFAAPFAASASARRAGKPAESSGRNPEHPAGRAVPTGSSRPFGRSAGGIDRETGRERHCRRKPLQTRRLSSLCDTPTSTV